MHLVAIAWIFVVVLMAAAEATSTQGTVLGAFFTLLLYGALPLWIVMYLLGTPARRRARMLKAQAEAATANANATTAEAGPEPGATEAKPAAPAGPPA